jgi:sulfur carrier protein ThiS
MSRSCDYCEESFANEDAYLSHLRSRHEDELGPIDRRRVGGSDDDSGIDTAPLALGAVLVVAAGLVAYVIFFTGGGAGTGGETGTVNGIEVAQMPTGQAYQGVHLHGSIEMTVTGDRVDFSRQQYQLQADPFHFEEGNGQRWHVHASGVTLEYAMATLGIEVESDAVTYGGTTYEDGDGHEVTVAVDGNPVDPTTYVLSDGDSVRIAVTAQ